MNMNATTPCSIQRNQDLSWKSLSSSSEVNFTLTHYCFSFYYNPGIISSAAVQRAFTKHTLNEFFLREYISLFLHGRKCIEENEKENYQREEMKWIKYILFYVLLLFNGGTQKYIGVRSQKVRRWKFEMNKEDSNQFRIHAIIL